MSASGSNAERSGPTEGTTDGPLVPSETSMEEVRRSLEHVELINVVPISIEARTHGNPRPCTDVGFQVEMQINSAPGFFGNRFKYEIELLDEDEEKTATLDFLLQVEYEVDDDVELESGVAEYIARTTGLFTAYPYARELAQTLSARLQQDPLVLGLMPRGATGPGRISLAAKRTEP